MKKINSDISGFYKLSIDERQKFLDENLDFNPEELKVLQNFGYLTHKAADSFIENVVGSYQLPMGIATHFKINDKDYIIPMVTEEPSVIAAASNAAKIARKHGGFFCGKVKSVMFSQIQIIDLQDDIKAIELINENREEILKIANETDPVLKALGGGAFDIGIRSIDTVNGKILVLHLLVDVKDAMGANIVNTMAEAVTPFIELLCDCKVLLRIVSNLSIERIATSQAIFDTELLGGKEVVKGIIQAYEFALADPYRATTHNKGIMNGICGVALATGNDTRAIEAGAHAFASLEAIYSPLTVFDIDPKGNLFGAIKIPLPLGITGGMTKNHPMAQIALKILGVQSAEELSQVAAAVGLAQNVAALRALASEGIQKGHMKLHSCNIAKAAGAPDKLVEKIAKKMIEDQKIRVDYAKELLQKLEKDEKL